MTRFERNRARAVFASSEADARGARSTFRARLDDMGAASIMMATSDLSRTTSETCYQGGKHREHALGWAGWMGWMGWVGWMDGWAGRAVVTAHVGLHAGRWIPRTTLFHTCGCGLRGIIHSAMATTCQRVYFLLLHGLRSASSPAVDLVHVLEDEVCEELVNAARFTIIACGGNRSCGGNRARFSMACRARGVFP